MPLSQGQMLQNRYRVVKLIGQGGFGAVYRAWDTSLGKACALKENFDTSAEAQRQFQREATILSNLRHPYLTRVSDHFIIPGQGQYLVMDFIEGKSLEEILDQRGRGLDEQQALPWFEQICQAVSYLHNRTTPIIHRDIKPANIIITPEDEAVLVDFGISKVYQTHVMTIAGARAISLGFSPVEQYGQGRTDARSDIYALGATLYALLTGRTPPESVHLLSGSAVLTPSRQLNAQISPATENAILRAMELKADDRFQSVKEFQLAIDGVSIPPLSPHSHPTPPYSHLSVPSATHKTGGGLYKQWGIIVAILLLAASIVFAAILLKSNTSSPPASVKNTNYHSKGLITQNQPPTPLNASSEKAHLPAVIPSPTSTLPPARTPSPIVIQTSTPASYRQTSTPVPSTATPLLPTITPTSPAATPTPIPTATPLPTATPAPPVIQYTGPRPPGRFGDIWDELGGASGALGIPDELISDRNYSHQYFTGGFTFWWDNPSGTDYIWVINNGGKSNAGSGWSRHNDTWLPSEPVYPPACPDAHKPNGPGYGFGKLWCQNSTVKNTLGQAVAPEFGSGDIHEKSILQYFSKGVIFYVPADQKIWALSDNGNWRQYNR